MDSGTPTKAAGLDWIKWIGWIERNKKKLLIYGGGAVAVIAIVALVVYNENQKEVRASQALSDIALPLNMAKAPAAETIDRLLALEREHAGTKAAARALLTAAGFRHAEGRYADAQAMFERFEKTCLESPWLPQALMGKAAALEAQQKISEAVTDYETLRKRYANEGIADEIKLNLARLYEKQNKHEEAHNLYQEVLRTSHPNYSSIGAEASTRLDALLEKHPELVKTNAPAVTPTLTTPPGTNRTQTITLTNLIRRTNPPTVTLTNRPGTNVQLLTKPPAPVPAPAPAAPPAK